MKSIKWLYPGMHVKRWVFLLLCGVVFLSLSLAMLIAFLYRNIDFPGASGTVIYYLTLQFITHPYRELLVGGIGIGVLGVAAWQLSRSLLSPLMVTQKDNLVDIIYDHRFLRRGPKIVAIGGGTGLSTLLRGLKEVSGNLTAIVTVADDGGSSGRLRRDLGVLPPGDFRNCIVAMADAEPLMGQLFQYRFEKGSDLEGHSFGNLFIVAMSAITGNFERAIRESSRVLAVRGQILPSTLANVTLCAELDDEVMVLGESKISKSRVPIKRVFLEPEHVPGYPDAIRAILEADLIILGPGSLYTSVLPNLLVGDIARAVRASSAVKVYVCNVATQPGETDHFMASDHIEALERHVGTGVFQYALVNSNLQFTDKIKPEWKVNAVSLNGQSNSNTEVETITADVVNPDNPLRHHPAKLAQTILRLYYDKAQAVTKAQMGAATV
ncbi:MAG: YvcK family protein [Chloroflexi bacterium]|nr:YvcK family protein [Chloroflexota bacterium]